MQTKEVQPFKHESSRLMLVTANVGSLFEDPTRLMKSWLREFLKKVDQLQPHFLALHLQEVGGKTYEKSMEHVQEFIRRLCEAVEMQNFHFIRIYMDEDFNSAEHFTALGNLYFAHKNLKYLKIWNFLTHNWELAEGKNIYSGNIETIVTKEKSKFPQHFFPECKWSRKGFMRTRWEISGTVIDLVNIHLFHDASNLAACQEFPSVYCKTRRRALVHTLERFHLDDNNGVAPYFIFGDFNFRCDTEGVIKELTESLTVHRVQSVKNDSTKVHYRNSKGDNVFTIGKKEFNHADHQLKFKEAWLKAFDKELEALKEILVEYPIEFPPSYPFEEDPEMPTDYMSTRCPSWCDRILMSPSTKSIILEENTDDCYNIIGEKVCMGDHKPIYLNVHLKPNQGTYIYCKCYVSSTCHNYADKSASLINPAAATLTLITADNVICPYKSRIYKDILNECKMLNTTKKNNTNCTVVNALPNQMSENAGDDVATHPLLETIQNVTHKIVKEVITQPLVSIKIIDSDNIHVCMCSQIACKLSNGQICPECSNIIQKQPVSHRYRLISKRLMLSENIIVNRIDTQYLNTSFDANTVQHRREPYTPESAESHSPCPELNTTTSNTSSNSRSPYELYLLNEKLTQSAKPPSEKHNFNNKYKIQCLHENAEDIGEQNRGIVSPGQLKSRLEDLQRSSMHSLNVQNYEDDDGRSGGVAGDSDVDIVDDKNCISVADCKRQNSCLPQCCNIH